MHESQLALMSWDDASYDKPTLSEWDVVLVNSSGGKDSQTMLREVVRMADEEGYARSDIVVAHAELGRVEWDGTTELAREQSEAYGLEFRSMARPQGYLLDHIEARGMFPSPSARYCTSDHKRVQIAKIVTALDRERRDGDSFSVLNCMGLRSEESPARRKRAPLALNRYMSTKSRKAWDWLPIQNWTEDMVWQDIRESGIRSHQAYELGMPRLSCIFCIFAPKAALTLAGRHNPELLKEYVRVEKKIGHRFRMDISMAEVQSEVDAGKSDEPVHGRWNM